MTNRFDRAKMNTPAGIRYQCACCGQYTIESPNEYEFCPVCDWEDDDIQNADPDFRGGANHMSLNEAREACKQGKPIH